VDSSSRQRDCAGLGKGAFESLIELSFRPSDHLSLVPEASPLPGNQPRPRPELRGVRKGGIWDAPWRSWTSIASWPHWGGRSRHRVQGQARRGEAGLRGPRRQRTLISLLSPSSLPPLSLLSLLSLRPTPEAAATQTLKPAHFPTSLACLGVTVPAPVPPHCGPCLPSAVPLGPWIVPDRLPRTLQDGVASLPP
jgi:hypothetical protein